MIEAILFGLLDTAKIAVGVLIALLIWDWLRRDKRDKPNPPSYSISRLDT